MAVTTVQSSPVNPLLQAQTEPVQIPWPVQLLGHWGQARLHAAPQKPTSHEHFQGEPSSRAFSGPQMPWPVQLFSSCGHSEVSMLQAAPDQKLGMQKQVAGSVKVSQKPWPEQLLGHEYAPSTRPQSAPL